MPSRDKLFEAEMNHAEYYLKVLTDAHNTYSKDGEFIAQGLEEFDHERENIERGFEQISKYSEKDGGAKKITLTYAIAAQEFIRLRFPPATRIEWLQMGLKAVEGFTEQHVICLMALGDAYREQGDFEKANFECYDLAKDILYFSTGGKHILNAQVFNGIGSIHRDLGMTQKAIEYFQKAIAVAQEFRDKNLEGGILTNLGNAYRDLGDIPNAQRCHEESLRIMQQRGDVLKESMVRGNLGNIYLASGNMNKAEEFYEQQLLESQKLGDDHGKGVAKGNLGVVYLHSGMAQKAIAELEGALLIARENNNKLNAAIWSNDLGLAYEILGDIQKAKEYFEQSLAFYHEIRNAPGEVLAAGNLGNICLKTGDTANAILYYSRQISASCSYELDNSKEKGVAIGNLGTAYLLSGMFQEAVTEFKKALDIAIENNDKSYIAQCQRNMGGAFACLNEITKAKQHFNEALAVYHEIGDKQQEDKVIKYLLELILK